jgi:hypothetical protein
MPLIDILWDLPDDPNGNVQHIAEHGLVPSDVEHVLNHSAKRSKSRSSGLPLVVGVTPSGEMIAVIYEEIDEHSVYPVTAYQIED